MRQTSGEQGPLTVRLGPVMVVDLLLPATGQKRGFLYNAHSPRYPVTARLPLQSKTRILTDVNTLVLLVDFQLLNVEGMMELGTAPMWEPPSNNYFRRESAVDSKTNRWKWTRTRCSHGLQGPTHQCLLRGVSRNWGWRKLVDITPPSDQSGRDESWGQSEY